MSELTPDNDPGSRVLAVFLLGAAVLFALSPLLTEPFSGFTEDQLPIPQMDPPVQPAGYAFSIWGVIYLWLIASTGFGLFRRDTDPRWSASRLPLLASLVVGVAWLPVANASAVWATILIWVMLAGAAWALLVTPRKDVWWLRAPVGLYAGWLTAASWVSLATVAAGYGLVGDAALAAYLGIAGALATSLAVLAVRPDASAYVAAVIWALIGIVAANTDGVVGVAVLAAAGALALAVVGLRGLRAPG